MPWSFSMSSNPSDSKLRVLIVDDEVDICSALKLGLERLYGHHVNVFNDPIQALNDPKPNFYDIIVLDIRMPSMDGLHLSRMIRQMDSKCQICFMSAFEINESEAEKVLPTLPSHCFIKKPIAINALANHIQRHFVKSLRK
jgi:DNA-binding NtrC family response regulator